MRAIRLTLPTVDGARAPIGAEPSTIRPISQQVSRAAIFQ